MSKDQMRYKTLVDQALRGVVKSVLAQVVESGLPGAHHLYLTFRTDYPGVIAPAQLRQLYPQEITIVLQHQFWGLTVGDEHFEVTLSFGGAHEVLSVPYAALTGIVDPSVKFGLQFEPPDQAAEPPAAAAARSPQPVTAPRAKMAGNGLGAAEPAADSEKVVTLDTFRKK
ncbi:MAG: hypothetical protein EXQ91_01570 [Alphaproteobacteria bacterium]|nr:hypothetical protein [Alphaproteobacteria bacterium]